MQGGEFGFSLIDPYLKIVDMGGLNVRLLGIADRIGELCLDDMQVVLYLLEAFIDIAMPGGDDRPDHRVQLVNRPIRIDTR